jgi:multicomponent Na+:H+ antiporter subunit E
MMTPTSSGIEMARSILFRASGYLILWLVLFGDDPSDLAVGALAAGAATWLSLWLLPPGDIRLRLLPLLRFALRFLGQSIVAGADVARRALAPALPLNPGFVTYPVRSAAGVRRNTFTTLMSLLPGTVPVGEDRDGVLVIHCLDTRQPVAAQLTAEEAMLIQVIGGPDLG